MKKILKYIGIVLLLLAIPTALAFVPIGNNIILNKRTNELKNFGLNAGYEVLAVDSKCGKLTGNGNGMQYFSALLIHSTDDLKCENYDFGDIYIVEVNDEVFDEFITEYDYGNYCNDIKNKLKDIKNTKNYYVMYSFYDAGLNSIWSNDFRAH